MNISTQKYILLQVKFYSWSGRVLQHYSSALDPMGSTFEVASILGMASMIVNDAVPHSQHTARVFYEILVAFSINGDYSCYLDDGSCWIWTLQAVKAAEDARESGRAVADAVTAILKREIGDEQADGFEKF